MPRQTFEILGVKLDTLSYKEAEAHFSELVDSKDRSICCTPNVEFIMRAQNDQEFLDILNKKSKMNLADSFGMLWAARFLSMKKINNIYLRYLLLPVVWLFSLILIPFVPNIFKNPLKDRIPGSDFIWSIARLSAKNNYRLFLFGGAPTVAERAALKLQTDVYGLRVAGVYPGDMTKPTEEIVEAINRSRADIILVCLGSPLQERWLVENLSKTCCRVGIGLGGTFDFTASVVPRAPRWMQKTGLEWLFRLVIEPKRIFRQVALPKFIFRVLQKKLVE
jgi:N-acetylglucosaminyldiphosphoundecaprenol N-acetyl-beta-D-mannosaminyltransferase